MSGLKTVKTGDVSQVAVGDPVLALGNALGQGGTPAPASGTVMALDQTITATDDNGSNPETLNGLIEDNAAARGLASSGDRLGLKSIHDGTLIAAATASITRSAVGRSTALCLLACLRLFVRMLLAISAARTTGLAW